MNYQIWSFSSLSGIKDTISGDVIFYASNESNVETGEAWYKMATAKSLIMQKDYIMGAIASFSTKKEANKLLRLLKKDAKEYKSGASWELIKV